MTESIILVIHVLLAFGLIGLILIQHGKGADAGAAFGSGSSGTVFGASGSTSFLTKLTTWIAIAFFATSLGLAYISAHSDNLATSIFDQAEEVQVEESASAVEEDVPVVEDDIPTSLESTIEDNLPTESDIPSVD